MGKPTGFEWGIILTGSAVVVTLAVFYGVDWDSTEAGRAPVKAVVKAAATPVARQAARPRARPTPTRRSTFTFAAARGDAWLQVRAGSFAGRVLFEGKLLRGESLRLGSPRLWVRFGAAAHVDLSIDGRRARLPAFGTYDAFVGPRGVRQDRTLYATAAQSP